MSSLKAPANAVFLSTMVLLSVQGTGCIRMSKVSGVRSFEAEGKEVVGLARIREESGEEVFERPIGEYDLVRIYQDETGVPDAERLPARYRPLLDAIGQTMPVACTAAHLGRGLVLTAGHCFGTETGLVQNQPCRVKTRTGALATLRVAWGSLADRGAVTTSPCASVVAMEWSETRDFAVLRITQPPPVAIPVVTNARTPTDSLLTLIGHPGGRSMEWSKTCTLRPWQDAGDRWPSESFFTHVCDTEYGSSGSPVIEDATLSIVGIHDGGETWPGGGANYATSTADPVVAEEIGRAFSEENGRNLPPPVAAQMPPK